MAETTQQSAIKPRGNRRTVTGRVINDTASAARTKKTVVVEVVRRYRDPVYGKYVKARKRYYAHDETEQYQTNDVIEIRESRPMSKLKRWVVIKLITRPEKV